MHNLFLLAAILMMPTTQPYLLIDFSTPNEVAQWQVINDGVMGGRSRGSFSAAEGDAVFEGTVSLENSGGFTSVRRSFDPISVEPYSTVVLYIEGDGRRYQFRIKQHPQQAYAYTAYFQTKEGPQVIMLPFNSFIPSFRGSVLDKPPYAGDKIGEIGILIGNKKAEAFRLKISKIVLE
jgi:hypothetical protein